MNLLLFFAAYCLKMGSSETSTTLEKVICSSHTNHSHRLVQVTLWKVSETVSSLYSVSLLETLNYTDAGSAFPWSSKCDELFSLGRKASIDVTKWLENQPHDIINTSQLPGCFFHNKQIQKQRLFERKGNHTQHHTQGVKHLELWLWAGNWAIYKVFLGWFTESLKWDKACCWREETVSKLPTLSWHQATSALAIIWESKTTLLF